MTTATVINLYLDCETIPTQDSVLIDEIMAKHDLPMPDLSSIKPAANLKDEAKIAEDVERRKAKAMSDWEEAQGRADAAADEAYRKSCLDATTGHLACVSFAIDDAPIAHVRNASMRLFSRSNVVVAAEGDPRSPCDTVQMVPSFPSSAARG